MGRGRVGWIIRGVGRVGEATFVSLIGSVLGLYMDIESQLMGTLKEPPPLERMDGGN